MRLNDYLDIICPHYEDDSVPDAAREQYTLYLVEREQYQLCQPQSKDQVRWQCDQPSAPHGPEKLSEKFQRFTPFTLGKEFKEGHSYYYICECALGAGWAREPPRRPSPFLHCFHSFARPGSLSSRELGRDTYRETDL